MKRVDIANTAKADGTRKSQKPQKPEKADRSVRAAQASMQKAARRRELQRARKERDFERRAQKRERERQTREQQMRVAAQKREREKVLTIERERRAQVKRELDKVKQERRKTRFEARLKIYRKIKDKLKNDPRGFCYSNYGFLPRVELIVRGDGGQIAALFADGGIRIADLAAGGGNVRMKIRKKDLNKAVAILDRLCYNFQIGESYGVGRLCSFALVRSGVFVGAIAAAVALNISYSHIWRIDISGNAVLSDAAVERVLRDAGFVSGVKKSKVDTNKVCAAVNGLDGVSDAGAEMIGTTLYVYVLESKDFAVRDKAEAYEAAYDATVTRIVLRSGTAKVKRGDVVKRGDLLADGDVYSTTGELLYGGLCDADVYGEVSLTFTAEIGDVAVEYRRTGRKDTQTSFTLFGHRIFKPKPPFKSYESVVRTSNYDVLIPLYVTTYEFYETKPVEAELDVEQAAKQFAAEKAKELEFTGDFKSSYSIKQTERGTYRVNLFLGGEALISKGTARRVSVDGGGK